MVSLFRLEVAKESAEWRSANVREEVQTTAKNSGNNRAQPLPPSNNTNSTNTPQQWHCCPIDESSVDDDYYSSNDNNNGRYIAAENNTNYDRYYKRRKVDDDASPSEIAQQKDDNRHPLLSLTFGEGGNFLSTLNSDDVPPQVERSKVVAEKEKERHSLLSLTFGEGGSFLQSLNRSGDDTSQDYDDNNNDDDIDFSAGGYEYDTGKEDSTIDPGIVDRGGEYDSIIDGDDNTPVGSKRKKSTVPTKKKRGPRPKEGGTATPQDDDIIVGNNTSNQPRAFSTSLSNAITSRKQDYAKAEGDDAEKLVAKECIESFGDVRVLEKYHRDGSHKVLNKNESIAYVLRIFKHRARTCKQSSNYYKKNNIKEKRRESGYGKTSVRRKAGREYYHKNKDIIKEKNRAKTRKDRAAESSATAKIMRQESEEYKAQGGRDKITAKNILMPPIEVDIREDKNDRPVVYYKTPTNDDPYKVNDANVLTKDGIGKGKNWFKPAQNHVSPVPPENMELTGGELMIKPNRLVSKQKRKDCGLKMYELASHTLHDKWYTGINMKISIKFHMRHWKCFAYKEGDVLYICNYYSTNKVYNSCFQCKLKNGIIGPACALLSGSIIMGTPCSVVKAILGKDLLTLTDTKFEFIRINRDMKTVVSLPLDDDSLIVTPYEVTTKPSEEVNEGAVAWDASRESEKEDLTEEEEWGSIWEQYEHEHTDAYFNQL